MRIPNEKERMRGYVESSLRDVRDQPTSTSDLDMKLIVRHYGIRSANSFDALIEQRIHGLEDRLHIDEADVCLERRREMSPAFRVYVHLATPGPNLMAQSQDHTMRAAIDKVIAELDRQITSRSINRERRIRSNLQSPASLRERRA